MFTANDANSFDFAALVKASSRVFRTESGKPFGRNHADIVRCRNVISQLLESGDIRIFRNPLIHVGSQKPEFTGLEIRLVTS